MTEHTNPYTLRPGKYIEYDFPLREVNRLAEKEAYAKKPIYIMHKWWARRLSSVFRTVLLASAVDWTDWDALEPWKRGVRMAISGMGTANPNAEDKGEDC